MAENIGSTPKRPRFSLSAGKTSKRSLPMSNIGAPDPKRARLELQPATCPGAAYLAQFDSNTKDRNKPTAPSNTTKCPKGEYLAV